MKDKKGFTLVELMVVLAITGVLLMKGVAFGVGWMQSAKISEAESTLLEAISRAKASALMNQIAVKDDSHVTSVCLVENIVKLYKKLLSSGNSCSGEVLWQQALGSDVKINVGSQTLTCICFDNRGHRTLESCESCSVLTTYNISAGNSYETSSIL